MTATTGRGVTGAESIIQSLQKSGTRYIFGMSGHANLALLDAIAGSEIQFISVPHEQLAVHAADCYHRATGRLGVVLTTLGPGLTNTACALTDAIQDCSALLVMAGNVPQATSGREAYQELAVHSDAAQLEVIRPLVKRAWRATDPNQVIPFLVRAYATAMAAPRGPVMLDLPMDLMSMTGSFEIVNLAERTAVIPPSADQETVARAAELLALAKRPLIYCGGGAVQARASAEVIRLAHLLDAPVVTTLSGQAVMATTDPLFGGVTGSVGTPTGHGLAANADVVLAIGSRFSDMDASSRDPGYFFTHESVRVIQVDIDPAQIGRHFPVELGVVADAKRFVAALGDQVELAAGGAGSTESGNPRRSHEAWRDYFVQLTHEWNESVGASRASDETPLTVERVLTDIGRIAADKQVNYLSGIGPRYLIAQHLERRRADAHFAASGSGTMGWGVPGTLGISLGRPGEHVVAIIGDGEFKSTFGALAIAAEYNIPAIWIVINNSAYYVIELFQTKYYGRLLGSTFRTPDSALYSPDYALLASAFGVHGERIETPDSFEAAFNKALNFDGPTVLDVIVSRSPQLRASGFWESNRYLTLGWNDEAKDVPIGGFGDQPGHASWRRSWDDEAEG